MKSFYFFICLLSILPSTLYGQKRWQLDNIHVHAIEKVGASSEFNALDLRDQANSAAFPNYHAGGLQPYTPLIDINLTGALQASVTAGFYPYSKNRGQYNGRKEWQIGIFYEYVAMPGPSYRNSQYYLYSLPDTMTYYSLDFDERRQYIGISNSITFRTNPESRINIFGGAEVDLGIGISGKINSYSDHSISVRSDSGAYKTIYGIQSVTHYPTYSAFAAGMKLYYGLGIRFLHHIYFSLRCGEELSIQSYFHAANGASFFLLCNADVSIALSDLRSRKYRKD